jgi:preprotein translocase subunit SecA
MSAVDTIVKGLFHIPRMLFGTRNSRVLKRMQRTVEAATALEPDIRRLCSEGEDYDAAFERRRKEVSPADPEDPDAGAAYERKLQDIRVELCRPLRERAEALAERFQAGAMEEESMPEAFAILREASRRAQNHRHFDCQLIGGQTLTEGRIAEMRTGEGKTIVCHLAAFLKVSQGLKVHVVTVNDYLVKRDADFAAPIFELLGYAVGYIQAQVDPGGREGVRKRMYGCPITYGTASEFGFDYLRDNMKVRLEDQVQGALDFVIIDEVDSILIDEARTPLIISGPTQDDVSRYPRANKVAEELVRRQATWDRRLASTTAKYDGETHNIPKLGDAMAILGAKERKGTGKKRAPSEDATADATTDTTTGAEEDSPTLGPDFLTDDHVEAIQIYENNVLGVVPAEQYRRYFIVQTERKQVGITHEGVTIAQELLDLGSLYSGGNMEWPHLIENALRAHKVYRRDRDYVVKDRLIIIVDTFTGRLMHGRQWSDGLHQAVEAKEAVPVKEETQTLATVTIQNFFKLYQQRSGMTGTAMTEAEEFLKIYKLDVIEIPTNRPVNRDDHNDKMYRDTDQKFHAIVDEIHEIRRRGRPADPFLLANALQRLRPILQSTAEDTAKVDEALRQFNDAELGDAKVIRFMCDTYDEVMGDMAVGRPVLVGTTSVEKSELLSRLLERKYGIEHEVLNAKNHAREAEIVAKAGQQTLPTRGADRRPLGNVTIATNMAGRGTDIKLGQLVVYGKCKVPPVLPEGAKPSALYPVGVTKCCVNCEEYDPTTNCAHCFKPKLDPRFPALGRRVCSICTPCGLHIIGTERHEARRIDNQLRGRSGRQGDPGSSRFSLSLQDDLLKLFMADWMLRMMERLGFSEGMSIEDRRLTKGIERAQRKVEETNFSRRKHLLEWDEPMDFQRKEFYRSRQRILEGVQLTDLLFHTIDNSIRSTVEQLLGRNYRRQCVAEWCRTRLELTVTEDVIDVEDLEACEQSIRGHARSETHDQIRTSIGEYIDAEEPPNKWDVGGLLHWAQRLFKVSLSQNQLRKMTPPDIENALCEAADEHYLNVPLEGLALYLEEDFPQRALSDWAEGKFGVRIPAERLADVPVDEAVSLIRDKVREVYHEREVRYPVESCMARAYAEGVPPADGAELVSRWANGKFRAGWTAVQVQEKSPQEVYDALVALNRAFLYDGHLEREIAENTSGRSPEEVAEWARRRYGSAFQGHRLAETEGDATPALLEMGRDMLRWELTRLEQHVLLRIYDQAWKDHLLEMDHLKEAIMQRPLGGDQTHPQSQYAIEGRDLFSQMWTRIADRVTDLVFKVKAGGPAGATTTQTVGDGARFLHRDATGSAFDQATRDTEAAMRAQNQPTKVEPIRREHPRVGRNDPCPCGSGKKFKQCHGRT